tara:strand:+ start:513 stop:1256 length:744 start_codon:yes stop_codon:yes gene_type:complete
MPQDNTVEYVIKNDQIIARQTFEHPAANVEDVIKKMLQNVSYTFIPAPIAPVLSKWVKQHFYGQNPKGTTIVVITEVEYMPLRGAVLDDEGHIRLTPTPAQAESFTAKEKWDLEEDERLFVITQYSTDPESLNPVSEAPEPFMFMLKGGEPVIPVFPNIHSNGKICTGRSYKSVGVDYEYVGFNAKFKKMMDVLHVAKPNYDLNSASIRSYMRVADGIQQPFPNGTHRTATNELIIQASKWLLNNNL